MSSSLKGRTRLIARSFSSPLSRPEAGQFQLENKTGSVSGECTTTCSLEDIESCSDQHLLLQMHMHLKRQLCNNEKKLKNLELVERYNMKVCKKLNSPTQFINKNSFLSHIHL